MENIVRLLINWSKRAVRSLAFLPVPMIVLAIVLSFVFFYLENHTEISVWVQNVLPSLAITSQDTARAILTLFVGGLITLTVFTFSQIMILLNQVAANYGPRLLPKLTGDRSLQLVMGVNLGTIVLMLSVLVTIRSEEGYNIPNFSVLVCVLLGISCLILFVYFVTTISRRIQVDQLIHRVCRNFLEGLKRDASRANFTEATPPEGLEDWYSILSPIAGYIGTVNYNHLSELAAEYDTRFYIGARKGEFLSRGLPLLQSERRLSPEQVEAVMAAVAPIHEQFDDWYLPNLKQLTEIALKALSPGINDPGTALTVIDRQCETLAALMEVELPNHYRAETGGEVWFARHDFDEVLAALMQEMRTYGRGDPLIVRRLFQLLFNLLVLAGTSLSYRRHLEREVAALLEDARNFIDNSHDRHIIAEEIRAHRRGLAHHRRLIELRDVQAALAD